MSLRIADTEVCPDVSKHPNAGSESKKYEQPCPSDSANGMFGAGVGRDTAHGFLMPLHPIEDAL